MSSPTTRLLQAVSFAAHKHRDQRRKDAAASPYINHPIALASLLERYGVHDLDVLCAALLHDTIEDTQTSPAELRATFGDAVAEIVLEVTDDKRLPKAERKRLQIVHAPRASRGARLVKLADKICNLQDMVVAPPALWPLDRRIEYFRWAKAVIDGVRGTHAALEAEFDAVHASGLAQLEVMKRVAGTD